MVANQTLNRAFLVTVGLLCLFGVISCTSPSSEGTQGRLKASIPITGEWILE